KKTASKKVVAKKTVTKKTVTKKTVTKKVATKKVAAKKVVTKKAAPKKVVAKKTTTGKVAAKKAPTTKVTTRKTATQRRIAAADEKAAKKRTALTREKKTHDQRPIRCYLCGRRFDVSALTMSTTCPSCHRAIKVEDVRVKSYLPVIKLQTCGRIEVTRRGRVAAKTIQSGDGIECEGALEGDVETDGSVALGAKSSWKGKVLNSRVLTVEDGASLVGFVNVPWQREDDAEDDLGD
ncbi:MAG: polymer-forming cytoskeletal protein, partial [Planctomycetes bacterium]|nr:polymer-forming cytoskeletal protein [Planctomycetota bacterium]